MFYFRLIRCGRPSTAAAKRQRRSKRPMIRCPSCIFVPTSQLFGADSLEIVLSFRILAAPRTGRGRGRLSRLGARTFTFPSYHECAGDLHKILSFNHRRMMYRGRDRLKLCRLQAARTNEAVTTSLLRCVKQMARLPISSSLIFQPFLYP